MNTLTTTTTKTTATYTDLINLYAHHLGCMKNELENVKTYTLAWARRELVEINNHVELACNEAGKNWGPILSEGQGIKASSRALFIQRINEALEGLEGLKAAFIKYHKADAEQAQAEAEAKAETTTQSFINRCVLALDAGDTGEHSVYVHWFRIDYGCWMDAEAVVLAGGLADYLETLGLEQKDVAELMTQDWDCQDAEGLAARCICNYGGFDWLKLEELLEVDVEPAVLAAGLDCGLEPDAIEDAYMGEWDSAEDMAYEMWDQCGMLESVPEAARGYINWAMVARDMVLGGDVTEANGHYFHAA